MAVSIDFQNRITDLVAESENKKSELPMQIGIDYRSLSNALNYGIVPKPRILIRIADYYNISIKFLLGKTEDEYFEKSKNPSNFKNRLNSLCAENKITYYKLGKVCHFDKSYISRWLNRNYLPSLEILEVLADYFMVSIDYLLGRSDEK